MNPNDPRVISVYGEALLRVNELEKGIEYLEKAYELDPIPQGQTTSDRRLAALFLAYFLKNDFDQCQKLNQDIVNIDIRTWLLNAYMFEQKEINYEQELWFSSGLNQFKGSNWDMEVDRFHLNNDSLKNQLTDFAKGI